MTTEQQLKDRFDRIIENQVPHVDLSAAISRGRSRRRRRAGAYAVGSLAALAVAASAVVLPHLGGTDVTTAAGGVTADGTFVPGTTTDTDLAAVVAAADPSLPAPRDVYPSDWTRDTPLPDADFADATEWQLVYDLSPTAELLVYVTKPIPGLDPDTACPAGDAAGTRVVKPKDGTTQVDVPYDGCVEMTIGQGHLVSHRQVVGDPGSQRFWFLSSFTDADGRFVNVIEKVTADDWAQASDRSVLPPESSIAIASAAGLDFPDPVDPPPAP